MASRYMTMVLLASAVSFAEAPRAQEYLYSIRHLKIDPTKSGNFIRTVHQDERGILLLGTNNGLYHYNGFVFSQLRMEEEGRVWNASDVNGIARYGDRLYLATRFGLRVLDPVTYAVPEHGLPVDERVEVRLLSSDDKKGLWWYNADGHLYNLVGRRVRKVYVGVNPYIGMRLHGGVLWMFGGTRILAVRISDLHVTAFEMPLATNLNMGIYQGAGAPPHMYHAGRLYRLEADPPSMEQTGDIDPAVSTYLPVGDDAFLVRNNTLVHRYRQGGAQMDRPIDLGIDVPFTIMQVLQRQDRILVATSAGLVIVTYRLNQFNPLRSTRIEGRGMYEDPRGIAEDSRNYYLTGYHSIVAFDKSTNRGTTLNSDDLISRGVYLEGDTLWIATESNGLIRFNVRTRRYDYAYRDETGMRNFLISVNKWRGKLLVGGYRHFAVYDLVTRSVSLPRMVYGGIAVHESMVKKILPLGEDRCLIGTEKGIFLLDADFNVLRHYRYSRGRSLSDADRVNDFLSMPDGSIWAGTFDGLVHFSSDGRALQHFTRAEGLAGRVVATLARDANGYIWAGTYDGLSKFDPRDNTFANYYREDGLPDNEFNQSSILQARSGELLIGTVSGFIRFHPERFGTERRPADSIRISRVDYGSRTGDTTMYNPDFGSDRTIRIGKGIYYVKLHFFNDPLLQGDNALYEYRIDGIHKDWVSMGSSPILHLDNAKTGRYTLRVRFIPGSGSEAILEQSYPLVVEQYFYTTPWFYALIIGALLLMIGLYVRSMLQRQLFYRELRMEIARDLHDELGGYLSGINMSMDLMDRHPERFGHYRTTISQLGQRAVSALRDGIWSLDPRTDSALQLWDRIRMYAQQMLEPMDIGYRFRQTPGLSEISLGTLEKRNLLYVAKECIANRIKYGDGGSMDIEWMVEDGCHVLRFSNGITEAPDREEGGWGLHNIRNRMLRIGAEMSADRGNGTFTVTLKLKFIRDHVRNHRG